MTAEQARAYLAVQRALRSGELSRPWGCSRCGDHDICGPHGHHHNGYREPLDVIWLCRLCVGHCVTTNRECAIYQPPTVTAQDEFNAIAAAINLEAQPMDTRATAESLPAAVALIHAAMADDRKAMASIIIAAPDQRALCAAVARIAGILALVLDVTTGQDTSAGILDGLRSAVITTAAKAAELPGDEPK